MFITLSSLTTSQCISSFCSLKGPLCYADDIKRAIITSVPVKVVNILCNITSRDSSHICQIQRQSHDALRAEYRPGNPAASATYAAIVRHRNTVQAASIRDREYRQSLPLNGVLNPTLLRSERTNTANSASTLSQIGDRSALAAEVIQLLSILAHAHKGHFSISRSAP